MNACVLYMHGVYTHGHVTISVLYFIEFFVISFPKGASQSV